LQIALHVFPGRSSILRERRQRASWRETSFFSCGMARAGNFGQDSFISGFGADAKGRGWCLLPSVFGAAASADQGCVARRDACRRVGGTDGAANRRRKGADMTEKTSEVRRWRENDMRNKE